ncbi:MAG: late competence development ComFB family protein [Treponema sp.]|jgi:competence protein ComFB|nr:late competence development ComFB family protein [Treponema sp.]
MSLINEYDFELLENEAEKLVLQELENQLAVYQDEICRCKECIMDMAAMALNGVKPLYRVSLLGSLYTSEVMRNDEHYAKDVRDAVSNAIEKIRRNPAH